ncbi:MAG: hypothetical protein V8T36_10830 [Ruthenibacterium lactatiformans]
MYATDTEKIGIAAVLLGAGREIKESVIDPAAGMRLLKKAGDPVKKGDVLAGLYAGDEAKFAAAEDEFRSALTFAAASPAARAGAGPCRQGRRDAVLMGAAEAVSIGRLCLVRLDITGRDCSTGECIFPVPPYVSIGCVASARPGAV